MELPDPRHDAIESKDVLRLTPHFRLQWEPAQASHVLLFPEGMVKLTETAAVILEACRTESTLEQIIDEIESRFAGDGVADDVHEFLREAVAERWVTIQRHG